jgi:hypothetical protein
MKVYMVITQSFPDMVAGSIIREDGLVLGVHLSSNLDYLKRDLSRKVEREEYELIDCLDGNTPEFLKHSIIVEG